MTLIPPGADVPPTNFVITNGSVAPAEPIAIAARAAADAAMTAVRSARSISETGSRR